QIQAVKAGPIDP
ncbi:hypothetical protein CLOP_g4384, partial [Closterium sp. NIES-67]